MPRSKQAFRRIRAYRRQRGQRFRYLHKIHYGLNKGYDVLLVWALDRLSREGVEATLSILRRFRQHGVPVVSLQEAWTETGDAHFAELLSSLYAWMAHAESQRRSERTKAGLARRKAEGKPIGRREGAKDSKPRKRSGYVARWEHEREAKAG